MSDEVENKEIEGISRISEYSQAVKVFLSTIDELRKRSYSKDVALNTSERLMGIFLAYKSGLEAVEEYEEPGETFIVLNQEEQE